MSRITQNEMIEVNGGKDYSQKRSWRNKKSDFHCVCPYAFAMLMKMKIQEKLATFVDLDWRTGEYIAHKILDV